MGNQGAGGLPAPTPTHLCQSGWHPDQGLRSTGSGMCFLSQLWSKREQSIDTPCNRAGGGGGRGGVGKTGGGFTTV